MTYCVGLKLDRGIVFASDSRTNAGFDNIASFSKMRVWDVTGDRVIVLLSAGNLAVTQAVVSSLEEGIAGPAEGRPTLNSVSTMFQAARLIGTTLQESRRMSGGEDSLNAEDFAASFILGGQIAGDRPRLFQIYNEGNFIEATEETPYFQIGEHKYGKPIIDRVARRDMRMGEAAKLLLLSFDSTVRSNLSVGLPIDLLIYRADALQVGERRRIGEDDDYFRELSAAWSEALRDAFARIEEYQDTEENQSNIRSV